MTAVTPGPDRPPVGWAPPGPASPPPRRRATLWPQDRAGTAALAVGTAVVTSLVAVVALGPAAAGGWVTIAAGAHVVGALWAIADKRMVGAQVAAGVALCWVALVGAHDAVLVVVALVAGVVATAELLAACGRLGMVVERAAAAELRRAGLATVLALASSAIVVAAGALPWPGGVPATVTTVVALVLTAVGIQRVGRRP